MKSPHWFHVTGMPSVNMRFIRRETKWLIAKKNNDPRSIMMYELVEKHLRRLYFKLHPELRTRREKQEAWDQFYESCEHE